MPFCSMVNVHDLRQRGAKGLKRSGFDGVKTRLGGRRICLEMMTAVE